MMMMMMGAEEAVTQCNSISMLTVSVWSHSAAHVFYLLLFLLLFALSPSLFPLSICCECVRPLASRFKAALETLSVWVCGSCSVFVFESYFSLDVRTGLSQKH